MELLSRPSLRESLRLVGLLLLATLVWCASNNRWSAEAWLTPLEYGTDLATGDTKGTLAAIKSASEGHFTPFMPKNQPALGAPGNAIWEDMPITEQFQIWLPGVVARFTGLFFAANFAVLMAQLLAVAAFYGVARILGAEWTWAAVGALLFGFCRMATSRMIHHLPVTFYWHVPLCLLVCYWIAAGLLKPGSRHFLMATLIAGITGIQNPYYTAMFIQLAGLASLPALLRREWGSIVSTAKICAVAVVAFFAINLPTFLFAWTQGSNAGAILRNYQWLEAFALKPIDLFLPPPGHPIPSFAHFREAYQSVVLVAGEVPPSGYLGVFGILAFFWLLWVSVRNAAATPCRPIPMEAGQILYIAAFSIIGGLNGLVGTFGIHIFRSTNRYSIFILAIVLLFAVRHMPAFSSSRLLKILLPLAVAALGLIDQLPPPPSTGEIHALHQSISADKRFVQQLETTLPENAMVFQIPVSYYPEASAPGLPAYEHFRPYLHSDSLRYSYGHVKGRGLENWQFELMEKSPFEIVSELQRKGFQAITIYRPAFGENAAKVVSLIESAGRFSKIDHPNGTLTALVFLPGPTPSTRPKEP